MTDTEQILSAIAEHNNSIDEKLSALWKALPEDHCAKHKELEAFMGRLTVDEHLDQHEFVAPWQHRVQLMQDQMFKHAGTILATMLVLGYLSWLAKSMELVPK